MSSQSPDTPSQSTERLIPGEILEPQVFLERFNESVKKIQLSIRVPLENISEYTKYGHILAQQCCGFPEIVELMIVHSVQNGVEWGMDIGTMVQERTLLFYAILRYNYDLFKKLLTLNANPFGFEKSLLENVVNFSPLMMKDMSPEVAANIRRDMLTDLLAIGVPVSKSVISLTFRYGHPTYINILANSNSGSKILTSEMMREIMNEDQVKYMLAGRTDSMRTEIMALYNRLRVKESLEKENLGGEDIQKKAATLTARKAMEDFTLSPALAAEIAQEIVNKNEDRLLRAVSEKVQELLTAKSGEIINLALGKRN